MNQQDLFAPRQTAPAPAAPPPRRVLWVMLNPSTADARTDDRTILKCIGFVSRWTGSPFEMPEASASTARLSACERYRYHLTRGARGWAFEVVNLFAWRATLSAELAPAARNGVDIVGPENDDAIREAAARADRVIVAWGAAVSFGRRAPEAMRGRREQVLDLLKGHALWCLGTAADGNPRHPLMLGWSTPLERFALRGGAS